MAEDTLVQAWQALDEIVEAFEVAWRQEVTPRIGDFVPRPEHPQYLETLLELVRVDLELRWANGCPQSLQEYQDHFPDLFDSTDLVEQIAFEEFRARRHAGERVSPSVYARQFGILTAHWPDISREDSLVHDRSRISRSFSGANSFPLVGSEFAGFDLQGELGRGAFSRVYQARQGDLANRLVVLKVSTETLDEADRLAQLQHGSIVPIYSVHRVGRMTAVCMPFFGATTLADVVQSVHGSRQLPVTGKLIIETLSIGSARTGVARRSIEPEAGADHHDHSAAESVRKNDVPVPKVVAPSAEHPTSGEASYEGDLKTLSGLSYVDAILWLGMKLADGLDHAHERGILHRDLKPANVLLADDGRPMLLDFNLSADLKREADRRDSLVGGTLPYMAPEQLRAFESQQANNDARSDVYSLGVILFELLTGRRPFPLPAGRPAEQIKPMLQDRTGDQPRLRRLNPSVTPAAEAIIRRCLEPDLHRRYQSAGHLRDDLDRHLKQLPLQHSSEPSLRERLQKWTRRHERLTTVLSVAVLIVGAASAVAGYSEHKRVTEVDAEIESLMLSGQEALQDDDPEVARGRFQRAWMLAQAEPALMEWHTNVAGWLDHARQASLQKHLRWRVSPRDFDARRDEALLLSLLLPDLVSDPLQSAIRAIDETLTFTIKDDPGWTVERERLILVRTELMCGESEPLDALAYLESFDEFHSRAFYEMRATLLAQAGRQSDADQSRELALSFPDDPIDDALRNGLRNARKNEYQEALAQFERVLETQPELFVARFLHGVMLLKLQRLPEAKITFMSCVAQHPQFLWGQFFLGVVRMELDEERAARNALRIITQSQPSAALKQAVMSIERSKGFNSL